MLKNKIMEFKDLDDEIVKVRISRVPASKLDILMYTGPSLMLDMRNHEKLQQFLTDIISYSSVIREDGVETKLINETLVDANLDAITKHQAVQAIIEYNTGFFDFAPLYLKFLGLDEKRIEFFTNLMNISTPFFNAFSEKELQPLKKSGHASI